MEPENPELAPALLLECVVGSRLHGTATPASDFDIRRVVASPLLTMLSPFRRPGSETNREQEGDLEIHELQHFALLLSRCNITALEILWSDEITFERPEMREMRARRHIFLESERLYRAARGYSDSQRKHVDQLMSGDVESPGTKRASKFAAAYLRVMHQAMTLLNTGDYDARDIGPHRDRIMTWRSDGFTQASYLNEFVPLRAELETALEAAYLANTDRFNPDYAAITCLVRDIYVACDAEYEARTGT